MKVNLSYSVELDEVLSSAEKLYLESKAAFEKNYNVLVSLRAPEFTDAKLEITLRNLRSTHGVLAHFAARLDEIHNILTGYEGLLSRELSGNEEPSDLEDAAPEVDEATDE
jgi:hypothetical protein